MKLSINTQLLAQELRLLDKIAEAKPTIPILSHVLLRTDGTGTLRLSATDLDVTLVTQCPATVHEPGATTFAARHLLQLVEQFPDEAMHISGDGKISCGTFKSKLQCMDPETFPAVPVQDGAMVLFSDHVFNRSIAKAGTAIPDKAQKFQIEGALLTFAEGTAALVSMDGKRMAVATMPVSGDAAREDVILPSKVLRLLPDAPSTTFSQTEQHLFFVQGVRTYISRRVEGTFPAYQRIIPADNPHTVNVKRSALTAALRRVGLAADLSARLSLTSGLPSTLTISASNVTVGEADEVVGIDYTGPEMTITLRWRDLLDFLTATSEETVTLTVKDANTAVLCAANTDFLTVIMVMR